MNCLLKTMAFVASLVIISCGSTTSEETNSQSPVEGQVQASEPRLPGLSPVSDTTTHTTSTVPSGKPIEATGALNPEHGMPGHRCDISVGAPLNSAPATPPATTPTVQAAPAQPQGNGSPSISVTPFSPGSATPAPAPAAAVKTAPGMNPPHGEPGHDCAIAVGAPLKK